MKPNRRDRRPGTPPHDCAGQPDGALPRREFLRRVGITGAVAAGATAAGLALWQRRHVVPGFQEREGLRLPSFAVDEHAVLPAMAVAHGNDHEQVMRAALHALGGIRRFISPGDVVVIKPNVAFDRPPALAATTHPDALRALARLVQEAGASKILVADNPINSPAGCFLKTGLARVASDLNLDLVYPEPKFFAPLSMNGEVLKHWSFFYEPFRRADKVIGLAPCKDHNLCHASMTMKNWYGLLGGRRNQFHQKIHEIISDFALMMKPTFVVLDGMNVLMKNGPTGGRLSDVQQAGTMVVGTDMVSVDAYGFVHLLGRDLDDLTYVHQAHERGLGDINWQDRIWKEVQA